MKFIVGQKIGMTRVFDDEGRQVAVTKVAALPCVISRTKSKEKDGYKAVQVQVSDLKAKKTVKVCEFKVEQPGRYKAGQQILTKQFKKDELVTVQGTSKGKGFAGTIKRHGFKRGPETHGSNNVREPGSIGGGYPQRVVPGRRMAGRMGAETVTVKNLKIVDLDEKILLLAGAVPGPNKSIIKIYGSGEVAEDEVDTAAIEEQAAMEKMLEDDKAEKEEKASQNGEKSDGQEEGKNE